MAIQNTQKLTKQLCDLGNVGLQSFYQLVSDGEINDLAAYFKLGPLTVARWFGGVGNPPRVPYRRCVPKFTWEETPPGDSTPGYRVYDMRGQFNPTGAGDPTPQQVRQGNGSAGPIVLGGDDLSNLRQRCFLAFCLGVDGGLIRIPIYTGETKFLVEKKGSLKECVYRINSIYSGAFTKFLYYAWVSFEIFYDVQAGEGWELVIGYNLIDPANYKTEMEEPAVDPIDDSEGDGDDDEE